MNSPFASALAPSRIILGTASYGSSIPKSDAFAVLDAYFEAGGNGIDTANIYSSWEPGGEGTSERTVGEWIRVNGLRDKIILGTKGGHPDAEAMEHGRCTLEDLRRHHAESIERLGLSHLDIYWLHRDHPELPAEAIIDNLAALDAEASIGCFGASNWLPERIAAANAYAARQGLKGFVASQPGWALAEHETRWEEPSPMMYLDARMWAWHVETGFPLAPYAAQARGYFGQENIAWARAGFTGSAPRATDYDSPANRARLQTALDLARTKDCTVNQIALAYALHQPFPTFPIISTSNPAHVREAMDAPRVGLSVEESALLRR